MRRAVRRIYGIIAATAICGSTAARAVAVGFAAEDFSVNVGLLLRAGHYYRFVDWEGEKLDASEFSLTEAEVATYGRLWERVSYDFRIDRFYNVREAWAGVEMPAGLSAKIGKQFAPFGVEATTREGDLTCSSRTYSSIVIAPRRNYGLRFDYLRERDDWPYQVGAAAGVYNNEYTSQYPLVDGAWRIYGTPAPGVRTLAAGCSFYYGKEPRDLDIEPYIHGYYLFPAPRLGFDLTYVTGPFNLAAEYMQYYIQKERVGVSRERPEYVYKDDYYRGYFATLSYTRPLPYDYIQSVRPYLRYEHFKPAILRRGDVREDLYTGGLSLFFFDRLVMFRTDYTRIIEDECRTSNDRIASEFQLMF